ncbi:MAG: flavin reductase family protein [Dehalococcoidia bacterium]|nr:flavin reductase family protein [Dehalococcoidia bacterium]
MKKSVEGTGGFHHHYPRLAVVVTCHAQGKDNAMTVAWHSSVSQKPPLIGISIAPKRYTYELILEAGEFGVNFLPLEMGELIAAVGGVTGKDVDKFARFNIAREQPLKTSVPILADAYAAYECRLVEHRTYGDHEWFVGEVVATHVTEGAFTPAGILDLGHVNPALFLGAETYATTSKESLRHLERARYGKGLE